MKVEKKVTGKEDLVVEVSFAEFTDLLAEAVCEFTGGIKDDASKEAHEKMIFLSLTLSLFSAKLLKKLFKENEEEK